MLFIDGLTDVPVPAVGVGKL